MQQAVCPRCGSGTDVRTVGELFDMMNNVQANGPQAAWQNQQGPYPGGPGAPGGPGGPGQGSGPTYTYAGTGYSDYGPNNNQYGGPYNNQYRPSYDGDFSGDIGQDIANAVLGSAFKFVGRSIGKKVQQAAQAKQAQMQQQWQQSQADQAAIVERYPDLRGCMRDRVIFLEGGSRVVPITEIRMPVTLAQADAIVDKLRAP